MKKVLSFQQELRAQSIVFSSRMDSYVLAETFKYLYLLYSEKEDLLIEVDNFVFTTEAHLLPLSVSMQNSTLNASKVWCDYYKVSNNVLGGGLLVYKEEGGVVEGPKCLLVHSILLLVKHSETTLKGDLFS